jgi:hypothetical protein
MDRPVQTALFKLVSVGPREHNVEFEIPVAEVVQGPIQCAFFKLNSYRSIEAELEFEAPETERKSEPEM